MISEMSPLNTSIAASVFVTSKLQYALDPQAGEYIDLADYDSKEHFVDAMQTLLHDDYGEPNARLYYPSKTLDFAELNLVTTDNIDSRVWDILSIQDDDDILMLEAFIVLFGWLDQQIPVLILGDDPDNQAFSFQNKTVDDLLIDAKARFRGQFSSDTDFAYDELESRGFMINLPKIIEDNLDIDAIASIYMRQMNLKQHNGFYFQDY